MAQGPADSSPTLSTGQAAALCSVQPDTVLKWVRRGWLPATRTQGGHFRIARRDLDRFRRSRLSSAGLLPPVQCSPRPLRCWECKTKDGELSQECQRCTVYRRRSAWCLALLGRRERDVGGKGTSFCRDGCDRCPYLWQLRLARAPILLLSHDEDFITALSGDPTAECQVVVARTGYQACVRAAALRPVAVLLDASHQEVGQPALLENLSACVGSYGGLIGFIAGNSQARAIPIGFPVLVKPFRLAQVLDLLALHPAGPDARSARPGVAPAVR